MFFRRLRKSHIRFFRAVRCLMAITLALFANASKADEEQFILELKPQECVSLYKGQTCYLNLALSFKATKADDYCLFIKDAPEALICWNMAKQGTLSKDFQTDEEVVFELRKNEKVLSSTTLLLSWVYQVPEKKRAAWRLF